MKEIYIVHRTVKDSIGQTNAIFHLGPVDGLWCYRRYKIKCYRTIKFIKKGIKDARSNSKTKTNS